MIYNYNCISITSCKFNKINNDSGNRDNVFVYPGLGSIIYIYIYIYIIYIIIMNTFVTRRDKCVCMMASTM